jgi:N-acetylglucosamine kinase
VRKKLVAGVDGGATKTLCLVADLEGHILGAGSAGSSNYHNVGVEQAGGAIRSAVSQARRMAGGGRIRVLCAGLAGLDSPYDNEVLNRMVEGLGLAERNVVVHDSLIALYGATGGRPGVMVNAGTGTCGAGMNSRGEICRVSGWGHIFGDEGSAYWIGIEAVRAAAKAHDGRGPQTRLTQLLLEHFKVRDVRDLVPIFYIRGLKVEEVAALAPLVHRACLEGDRVALRIMEEAARELGEVALAAIHRLGMERERVEVATVGGVFESGPCIMEPFRRSILEQVPQAVFIERRFEPAVGALLIAYKWAGIEISGELLSRLEATLPAR